MKKAKGFVRPTYTFLYAPEKLGVLNLKEIADYLCCLLNTVNVDIRKDFISHVLEGTDSGHKEDVIARLASNLARIKVRNILKPDFSFPPLYGEIRYEEERVREPGTKPSGILYDGFQLQQIFWSLIPREEANLNYMHIIFTGQLFGTWDEDDLKYHARTSIYGYPNIISTTGLVEAPAKPREYYLLKQQIPMAVQDEVAILALKEKLQGRFLDYDDPRTTEVMKGYVAQALAGHATGFPFCQDVNCRLFNAHWQEELLHAQLKSDYEFCSYHREILE
jgi:hypothetical protein